MILNFEAPTEALRKLFRSKGIEWPESDGKFELEIAMVFATVFDKGMDFERRAVLEIIARKALNASELRGLINGRTVR